MLQEVWQDSGRGGNTLKKRYILVLFIIVIIAIYIGVICLSTNRINMDDIKEGEISFVYGDTNILHSLDNEELSLVKAIFNNKKVYNDNPSCGFSENISIKFDKSQTFCIACDTCPVVYWMEEDRYIRLMEEEKSKLYILLKTYGAFFPCI